MKTIAFPLLIIAIGSLILAANAAEISENKKEKRIIGLIGLVQFAKMIRCETGRSALWSYNNYGCWCGKGGSGRTVDATDRCCKAHDLCYARLERRRICWKNAWWYTPYLRSGCSGCSWFNFRCGKRICRCDQAAARCFKRALSTYNWGYKGYRSRRRC